jgi:hypothetical protein
MMATSHNMVLYTDERWNLTALLDSQLLMNFSELLPTRALLCLSYSTLPADQPSMIAARYWLPTTKVTSHGSQASVR